MGGIETACISEITLQDVEDHLSSLNLAGVKFRTLASSWQSLRAFYLLGTRTAAAKRVCAGIQRLHFGDTIQGHSV